MVYPVAEVAVAAAVAVEQAELVVETTVEAVEELH